MRLYVGSYTSRLDHVDGKGEGIATCELDPATGVVRVLAVTRTDNPSFLTLHPFGRFLYAANEAVSDPAAVEDSLSAFAVDPSRASLGFLGARGAGGRWPCHVAVDPSGRFLLSACYRTGSFAAHRIAGDGALEPAAAPIRHAGRGTDPSRQEGPHAHSLVPAPRAPGAPLFAVGCDLGLDTVSVFRLDEADGRILPHADVGVSPGAGPRSVAFDAAGRHAYVMTEMASTVVVLDWDPVAGRLVSKQEIAVLESGSPGPRHGTEVLLSPDGAHAYATNRGEDCIVIFRVDAGSGTLALVGRVALPGRTPRHSVFTSAGDMLLVVCQDSDEILSFRRHRGSGGLDLVARSVLPSPACIVPAARR